MTPLLLAARYGHTEVVKLLMGFGADLSSKNDDDWTSLHECIKLLIEEFGADINAADCKGRTPIFLSLEEGLEDAVIVLLEKSHADLNWKDENGQKTIVKLLIEQFHLDFHAKDVKGHTPLELADMPSAYFSVICDGCKMYPITGERYE